MNISTPTSIISRSFRDDQDFWRVRDLLIDTYPITPPAFNWEVRRWDGSRFHNADPTLRPDWAQRVHLWETSEGRLVAAAHPEDEGTLFLQVHPDFRDLEPEMILWGEANLGAMRDGRCQLDLFVHDYDERRQHWLEQHGYEKLPDGGVTRHQHLGERVLPTAAIASDYQLRATRPSDLADCQRMADLLNTTFKRTFHTKHEYYNFCTLSPSFRAHLNLVAEAPDGSFVSHVGVNYEPVNNYGIFEPVCTHPDHRRRGLARALMLEGLYRLKALGATDAYLDTGDSNPANSLYEAVGFTNVYHGSTWRKVL